MSLIAKLKKDELLIIEDLKLIVPEKAEVLDLKNLIGKCDVYKTDLELVKCVIECVVNEAQSKKSENKIQIELEKIKLKQ